jgi:hypothetical protein
LNRSMTPWTNHSDMHMHARVSWNEFSFVMESDWFELEHLFHALWNPDLTDISRIPEHYIVYTIIYWTFLGDNLFSRWRSFQPFTFIALRWCYQ